jgi:hypothetical protein
MPAKCANCDEVFDTSEDFRQNEEGLAEIECDLKNKSGVLCWECRRVSSAKKR